MEQAAILFSVFLKKSEIKRQARMGNVMRHQATTSKRCRSSSQTLQIRSADFARMFGKQSWAKTHCCLHRRTRWCTHIPHPETKRFGFNSWIWQWVRVLLCPSRQQASSGSWRLLSGTRGSNAQHPLPEVATSFCLSNMSQLLGREYRKVPCMWILSLKGHELVLFTHSNSFLWDLPAF